MGTDLSPESLSELFPEPVLLISIEDDSNNNNNNNSNNSTNVHANKKFREQFQFCTNNSADADDSLPAFLASNDTFMACLRLCARERESPYLLKLVEIDSVQYHVDFHRFTHAIVCLFRRFFYVRNSDSILLDDLTCCTTDEEEPPPVPARFAPTNVFSASGTDNRLTPCLDIDDDDIFEIAFQKAPVPMGIVELLPEEHDYIYIKTNELFTRLPLIGRNVEGKRATNVMYRSDDITTQFQHYMTSEQENRPVSFNIEYTLPPGEILYANKTVMYLGCRKDGKKRWIFMLDTVLRPRHLTELMEQRVGRDKQRERERERENENERERARELIPFPHYHTHMRARARAESQTFYATTTATTCIISTHPSFGLSAPLLSSPLL